MDNIGFRGIKICCDTGTGSGILVPALIKESRDVPTPLKLYSGPLFLIFVPRFVIYFIVHYDSDLDRDRYEYLYSNSNSYSLGLLVGRLFMLQVGVLKS